MKRRRRKPDPEKEKFWRDVFRRFHASGMSFRKFCAQEDISPNTFQYWRRELRERDESAGIVSEIKSGENVSSAWEKRVEEWKATIEEARSHPQGVRDYCRKNKIASQTLYGWMRRLMKTEPGWEPSPAIKGTETESQMFVPVTVVQTSKPENKNVAAQKRKLPPQPIVAPSPERIELRLPSGSTVTFPNRTGADDLIRVLKALESK